MVNINSQLFFNKSCQLFFDLNSQQPSKSKMKPNNFEQILESYVSKTYDYESYLKSNNITSIKYKNKIASFNNEDTTIFTMKADPVFTIQKLNKDIEQAVDAVDEEFLLFEHKNSSVDCIFNYCLSHEDQFTDIFKNPYKFNEDTYIFTSAMIMSVTNCDAIMCIEFGEYSVAFAAYNNDSYQKLDHNSDQNKVDDSDQNKVDESNLKLDHNSSDYITDNESKCHSDKASYGSENNSEQSIAYQASDEASD